MVFLSDVSNPNAEPNGLCLVCAKELGIKPIDDMLKKMNISDEDIEQMSEQFMDIMSLDGDSPDDAELNDDTFDLGTAPAMPMLNNIFGNFGGKTEKEKKQESGSSTEKAPKKKRRRFSHDRVGGGPAAKVFPLSDKRKHGRNAAEIARHHLAPFAEHQRMTFLQRSLCSVDVSHALFPCPQDIL